MALFIHMVYLLNYIVSCACNDTANTQGLSIELYSYCVCYETVHTHGLSIELYSLLCMH